MTQHLDALERANEVRTTRAKDKRRIERGELSASQILRDVPKHWETAKIVDLLMSLPAVGRVKASRWCKLEQVSLERRIVFMTERQRHVLARQIDVFIQRRQELHDRMAA